MQTYTKKKLHGQYYTESTYGSLLVNRFQEDAVSVALELGVGGGALLSAVSGRWPDARCVSVDIDPAHMGKPLPQPLQHSHYCADALNLEIDEVIGLSSGVADVAVCNPPFISADWKPSYSTLLGRAGFPMPSKALKVGADLLFLAQNLWLLKDKGQLGIIIPAGIICGERNTAIREILLAQHCVTEVVELPGSAFKGTEVKTFILNISKNVPSNAGITLLRCNKSGSVESPIVISSSEAIQRMDYSYYEWKNKSEGITNKEIFPAFKVYRGGISTYQAREFGWEIFHTTDLKEQSKPGVVHFSDRFSENSVPVGKVIARPGDILIPRVGRNISKGIRLVRSGFAPISDCLYAVRSSGRSPEELYEALTSDEGDAWLHAHIHGACARFLTKSDLLKFPL